MNLGWIRSLYTLSDLEKRRIKETVADPRRIEGFSDLESLIFTSLTPPPTIAAAVQTHSSTRVLTDQATPKMTTTQRTTAPSLPDQDLLRRLLKHRPQYRSGRILRAETVAATASAAQTVADDRTHSHAAPANHADLTRESDS